MSRFSRRRLDHVLDRLADLEREIELGAGEALGRIFEREIRARRSVGELPHLLRGGDRDLGHALAVGAEDDFALQGRGRVVEVEDHLLRALHRLEGALDQLRRGTGSAPGSRRRRGSRRLSMIERTKSKSVCEAEGKATSISLKPSCTSRSEHPVLAVDAHRLDQRLVAVAKIDRAPDRRLGDDARGPLAVGQDDRLERAVFGNRHGGHDEPWKKLRRPCGAQPA